MITFIHTADIHFGMENYGKIDSHTGIHSRLLDFAKALNFCIDFAIEKQVDFFLFCGDAYKTAHPSPTQQKLLLQCFMRLYKEKIPVIIIVGNHDNPLSFGKANALEVFGDLPFEGFHVVAKPCSLKIEAKNGPIQIVGIPWPTRNTLTLASKNEHTSAKEITDYISRAVSTIIADFANQLDPNIPAILASHLTVSSGIFSGSEKRAIYGTDPFLLPSQLAITPFDYIALGHLHRFQNLNPNGFPPIVYSGSIERVDFGERKEEKGFCYVKIKAKKSVSFDFIKTPTRSFIQIEIKLKPSIDHTKQILEEIKNYSINEAIIKIIYYLPENEKDTVDLKIVQYACKDAQYIVGILPIHHQQSRERRSNMANITMDIPHLLDLYFENRSEYKKRKDGLVKKTLELMQEEEHLNHDALT